MLCRTWYTTGRSRSTGRFVREGGGREPFFKNI
jgi:hypothetical protein